MDSSRRLWNAFEKSGKLSDYLMFCEERRRAAAARAERRQEQRENAPADQSSL